MTPEEHRQYYGGLSDASLRVALSHGPEGYADAVVWNLVEEEATKRGVRVRTGAAPVSPGAPIPPRPPDASPQASPHRVLVHRNGTEVAIKDGFSWPAFCFPTIWAAIHQLWTIVLALLTVTVLLGAIVAAVDDSMLGLAGGLVIRVIAGRKFNALRLRQLERQGFVVVAQVWATSPDDALTTWTGPSPS